MFRKNENLLKHINFSPKIDLKGKIGIEKESLRVLDCYISDENHNENLGSPLCNKFITTDFAEAQIELVTPPFSKSENLFSFLDNIQHFVTHNINDEYLWPFSMPARIKNEKEIKTAFYGISNEAKFKHIYRSGLAKRYGKPMQTISGIHVNFSFSEEFWNSLKINFSQINEKAIKNDIYFRLIRNFQRNNWLLLYLFGASPVLGKSLIDDAYDFIELNNDAYYLPYATSLRMSSMGYSNLGQSKLNISLDSLSSYVSDLKAATQKRSNEFNEIKSSGDNPYQLNPNLLQTEDEYYAVSRPKSSKNNYKRQISNLTKSGIDYIEIRSMDLNPFSRFGIEQEDLIFIELFIFYCAINPSPLIDLKERKMIISNGHTVSIEGRREGVNLYRYGRSIKLSEWAKEIILEMEKLSGLIGLKGFSAKRYIEMVNNQDMTLSGKIINEVLSSGCNFLD